VSVRSFRAAMARYRETMDLLGPYAGPCGVCGAWPDRRHRQAEALLGSLLAGEGADVAAYEYLREGHPDGERVALEVALACLATDPRLHGLTRGQAGRIAGEVYRSCRV
jgi:hypothetical protein